MTLLATIRPHLFGHPNWPVILIGLTTALPMLVVLIRHAEAILWAVDSAWVEANEEPVEERRAGPVAYRLKKQPEYEEYNPLEES